MVITRICLLKALDSQEEALEQDCYYQGMPSGGSGQGSIVPSHSAEMVLMGKQIECINPLTSLVLTDEAFARTKVSFILKETVSKIIEA